MGVSKFFKIMLPDGTILENKFPNVSLESLRGKRIAVDASNIIYRNLTVVNDNNRLTDADGNLTNNINSIFRQILRFKRIGIETIWVFDNPKPNKYKAEELAKRKAAKLKSKNPKAKISITSRDIEETQLLLTNLGVAYIVAPPDIESDHLAAKLVDNENPQADYVLSGDSDVLIFGGDLLRIYFDPTARSGEKTKYQIMQVSEVLQHLGIPQIVAEREEVTDPIKNDIYSRNELIRFSLSLGNDFVQKTRGVTEKNICKKYKESRLLLDDKQEEVFSYFHTNPFNGDVLHVPGKVNLDKITEFLLAKGFSKDRLLKDLELYCQTT